MTDRILLRDLAFYGYHGVHQEEKRLGQRFRVDLALELDLALAGREDSLAATIDYGVAYRVVREVVEGPSRDTIEAVAEASAAALLDRFSQLEAVQVRVSKPGAPIAGAVVGLVAVEIERRRVERTRG
jgi:7,8-dihydroneopterin aldolase/epimerase/oxygenase